jgi:glycosyltransferase involved in cell wall biosynthesis
VARSLKRRAQAAALAAVEQGTGNKTFEPGPPPPLHVLLIGRTHWRRAGGGIARSLRMIEKALRSVGTKVTVHGCHEKLTSVPQSVNVALHYGDLDLINQQLRVLQALDVPVIVNSTYDGLEDRARNLNELLAEWTLLHDYVYLAVFSHAAKRMLTGDAPSNRIVVMPKTIRGLELEPSEVVLSPSFEQRQGILLGELAKALRPRLVGINAHQAVEALKEALPTVPLFFYSQYQPTSGQAPPRVKIQPYRHRGFVKTLSRYRLFVCLSAHETFAMVPCEAQSAGTPVLYFAQPQSLDEHLAQTAYRYESVEELVAGVRLLYGSEAHWQQYAMAGCFNWRAKSQKYVGAALDAAFRKVVR